MSRALLATCSALTLTLCALLAPLAAPALAQEGDSATELPAPADASPTTPPGDDDAVAAFKEAHLSFYEGYRRFTPMIELRGLVASNGKADTERGTFDLSMIAFEAMVPVPISRDVAIIAGAQAHARRYRWEAKALGTNDDTLIGAGLRLGVNAFVNNDLMVMALWMPSVFSDFDGTLTHKDWYLWYGLALLSYRVNDTLYLKGGLALTDAFQDSGVMPIVGVSWIFAEKWRLDILIPRNIEVSFSPEKAWILHGGFEIEGEEYRMRSTNSGREFATGVQTVDTRLFLGVIHRFTDHISISARGGLLVGGGYDWADGTGFDYDGRLEQGVYASVGLGYTF